MANNSPGELIRSAWSKNPIAIPGVFNPLMAIMAENLGFEAVYLSGGALAAGNGVPDIGLLGLETFVNAARAITDGTSLPVLCDIDTGFGGVLNVERTIQQMENAGVAAVHLEDQQMPKRCGHLTGKTLVSASEMVSKIQAAVNARKNSSFVIIARTDARSVEGYNAVKERAEMYMEAGADAIFPEALESEEEFAQFGEFAQKKKMPVLANMTEFGRSPILSLNQLGKYGFRMVLFPLSGFRAAMQSAKLTLLQIKKHGEVGEQINHMLTRAELYETLNYQGFEERDRQYFGKSN